MKVIILLSLVAVALGVPNNYGRVEKTEIRIEAPKMPVHSSYEAPVRSTYEAPVRSTYVAPVRSTYEAPVVRQTYVAPPPPPVIKVSSYEAPVRSSYEAPVASYDSYGESLTKDVVAKKHIPIVSYNHQDDNKGSYKLDVKTGHGITHTETGTLKDLNGKEGPVSIKSGSYSYTGPDNKVYSVTWTADEHGFHAVGDHIPTPPPMPEEIQKSLALPRIKEFQPEFEHEHAHMSSEVRLAPESSYGGYSSYSQPSLPVRAVSHY